ncbi:delta-endotoxin CytB [Neolentinus lepideus HHB14362 ss-1]|uniref:Delta-endotoxin CytB n=1 Tax=Neolentinus lepideus HHB14362 ss-1 TaxID=1314782 RepID=A0A165TTT0_9AGAM|nr:delta-endotoxin CytB [Neolentinus lepideus HHB14362 ss-1]
MDTSSAQSNEQTVAKTKAATAAADSSTTFDSVTTLPEDLVPTGFQVMKFSGHYVRLTEPKSFDWDGFKYAVEQYPDWDLVGVPIDFDKKSISNEELEANPRAGGAFEVPTYSNIGYTDKEGAIVMPKGVEEQALENVLNWMVATLQGIHMEINVNELRATVTNVFTNLEWAHSSGFADFSSTSVGTNSSWEYRTVFGYPRNGDPSRFFSVVCTILLQADIEKESSWWGITTTTTARFHAEIKPGKLLVTKGFRSPV